MNFFRNKTGASLLLSVLLVIIVFSYQHHFFAKNKVKNKIEQQNNFQKSTSNPSAHQQIIFTTDHLIFTKHARCRMECRHINEQEIEEVITNGHINEGKSETNATPCPTYALEDETSDRKSLRIVFAKCQEGEAKVITCIELGKEFDCHCE